MHASDVLVLAEFRITVLSSGRKEVPIGENPKSFPMTATQCIPNSKRAVGKKHESKIERLKD